jgi:hypothetical protein
MYATVTRYRSKPGRPGAAGRRWRTQLGAALRRVPGVRLVHVLGDPVTGAGVVVVLWATKGELEAYLRSGQPSPALATFADLLEGPPVPPEGYDVLYTTAE